MSADKEKIFQIECWWTQVIVVNTGPRATDALQGVLEHLKGIQGVLGHLKDIQGVLGHLKGIQGVLGPSKGASH